MTAFEGVDPLVIRPADVPSSEDAVRFNLKDFQIRRPPNDVFEFLFSQNPVAEVNFFDICAWRQKIKLLSSGHQETKPPLTIVSPERFRSNVEVPGVDRNCRKDTKRVGELGYLHGELLVIRVDEVQHKVLRQLSVHASAAEASTHQCRGLQI